MEKKSCAVKTSTKSFLVQHGRRKTCFFLPHRVGKRVLDLLLPGGHFYIVAPGMPLQQQHYLAAPKIDKAWRFSKELTARAAVL